MAPDRRLQALIDRIPRVVREDGGFDGEMDRLATALRRAGPEAVPLLLPLLKHPKAGVRDFVGSTLRDIDGLNASHLDALIAAERRESGRLSPAIASIGTPRAVAFLTEQLRRDKEAESQVGVAFEILGAKGVPSLCRLLLTADEKEGELPGAAISILRRLDRKAKTLALRPLRDAALDPRAPRHVRANAIWGLGALGDAARPAVPELVRLSAQGHALASPADAALAELRAPEAVPGFLRELRRYEGRPHPRILTLRDLATLRGNGAAATPEVVRLLEDPEWDVRVAAARTLGFLGNPAAVPALVRLLSCAEDWRQVWAASESLGRIGEASALGALRPVAEAHWYPLVREAARKALAHLEARKPYPPRPAGYNFAWEYFAWEREAYRRDRPLPAAPADPAGHSLDVAGGTLVGTENGEWRGELVFEPAGGGKRVLLPKNWPDKLGANVIALARLGGDAVAVTGLAHITFNYGDLYRVTLNPAGEWRTQRWRTLPGAPIWAQARESGAVLRVACRGSVVDVAADGMMWAVE